MMTQSCKKNGWSDFKYKLGYLKDAVDSRYLVESLGIIISRETPKELRGACAIHGGDNTTSFRFNKERKTWVCFSHKCHDIFGNDVIGLIKAMRKVDFMDAVEYLVSLVGDFDSVEGFTYRKERERKEFIEYVKSDSYKHPKVNEDRLSKYMGFRSKLFSNEGFSDEILDYFEIGGGYRTSDGLIRDVIPIRDIDGDLVAYSLRDIRPDAAYGSKYWLTPGFNKDMVLYNLNRLVPIKKPLIIVEGFKSVWRLHQYGIKNSVCIMGSKITPGQQKLLFTYALHGIVLLFDNDVAGAEGALHAHAELKNKLDVDVVFITEVGEDGNGLDPADLSYEEIYGYLERYI
jgi:DNA primase